MVGWEEKEEEVGMHEFVKAKQSSHLGNSIL